jgi:hypothetical protein
MDRGLDRKQDALFPDVTVASDRAAYRSRRYVAAVRDKPAKVRS